MKKALLAAAAALLATAGTARADAPRTHDGFYLHLDLGAGGMASSTTLDGDKYEFSGGAGQFSLALGGSVAENFIVGGHLWGFSASNPELKVAGVKQSTAVDYTVGLSAVGVNLTYYFMPINIYLMATPSIGVLTLEAGGRKFETKSGFAFRLAAGKEWWVSDSWGLGVELLYAGARNKDKDMANPPTWSTGFFGVAFSATYQ